MPEYTIVRSDNGHVVLRTDKLHELPDKRTLKAMQMKGAFLYRDGVRVTGDEYGKLVLAIQDAQEKEYQRKRNTP